MPLDLLFVPPQSRHAPLESHFASLCEAELPLYARRERYESGPHTGDHVHLDFYALYLVRSGAGTHEINGRAYAMRRGDVYLMPVASTHAYRDYARLEVDAFYFQLSLLSPDEQAALRELGGFWQLFVSAPPSPDDAPRTHRLHLSPERWEEAQSCVTEIRRELDHKGEGALLARANFFRLLVWLSRWANEVAPRMEAAPSNANASLANALRVCEERFAEPLSVPQLAALMFVTPGHFSELFAREVGMPPGAYLRRIRLERACALLRDTRETTEQIARKCGFGSSASLSRAFRQVLNTTPIAYRRQSRV